MGSTAKKFDSIIIHIGTEKTGTSAIQHFLRDNERALERDGFYYPKKVGSSYGSQWDFVAAVKDEPWKFDIGRTFGIQDSEGHSKFKESFEESLSLELARARSAKHIVISSEHFHSRLTTKAEVQRLREFLERWTDQFKVMVFFRRQDRVAVSFFSTRAKAGVKNQGPCFPKTTKLLPHYYCYDKIFELWASVFGTPNMIARVYEDAEAQDGVIEEFCWAANIPLDGKVLPDRINKSLAREGFQFLHALNENSELVASLKENNERLEINTELTDLFPGKYYPVSRDEAIAFCGQFRQVNARLKELAFPDRDGPLFDDDFSDYPEIADSTQPSYEEAVAIGIELWRRARSRKQLETIGRAIRRKLGIR